LFEVLCLDQPHAEQSAKRLQAAFGMSESHLIARLTRKMGSTVDDVVARRACKGADEIIGLERRPSAKAHAAVVREHRSSDIAIATSETDCAGLIARRLRDLAAHAAFRQS
jgi:hypothetical protein